MKGLLKDILLSGNGGVISLVGAGGKTSLMFRLAREVVKSKAFVLTTTTTRIMRPRKNQSAQIIVGKSTKAILDDAVVLQKDNYHLTAAAKRTKDGEKLIGFEPDIIDTLHRSGRFRWILVEADGAARKSLKAPAAHEPVIPNSTDRVIAVVGLKAIGKPLTDDWVFRPEIFANVTGLALTAQVTPESVARSIVAPEGLLKGSPWGAKKTVFLNLAGDRRALPQGRELALLLNRNNDLLGLTGVIIGNAQDLPAVLEYHPCR